MKTETLRADGDAVIYRVEADPSEVEAAYVDGLEGFIQQFQLTELEGATPEQKIINAIGEDQGAQAIESAVIGYFIPLALKQMNVIPLSSSDILEKDTLVKGKPFSFTMSLIPKPEFELTDYAPFTVTVPEPPEVTDEDIDAQIQMLAQQFAEQSRTSESDPVVVPAVTDTWVQQTMGAMGLNTVAELRQAFRENSERALQEQYQQLVLDALLEVYFDRFNGEVTDAMVQSMTQDMVEQFKAELVQNGTTIEQYCQSNGITEELIAERLSEQAKNQLVQGFILDAVYRHEGLSIDVPDLMAMVHMLSPGNEEATFDLMDKTGRTFLLKEGAERNKALAWILENNKVLGVPAE